MIKGNDWVGNYSRFTYDESKNYVMLLKEKGVPVLDDEFNAPQEMLLAIIRRLANDITDSGFLTKDSFKISPIARENDFSIGAGVAIADGWRVSIETSVDYTTQPVTQPSLTTPSINRTDTVYLDLWHEEIDGVEDTNIIDPQLGLRTSCRLKLVWAVKVAEGSTVPPNGFDGMNKYHWRIQIAELHRLADNPYITSDMIVDKRGVLKISKLIEPYYATGQNNYSVTLNDVPVLSSGDVVAVTFQNQNTDSCSLSYNSSDYYPIKSSDGYDLPSGFLKTNATYFLHFTGSEFVVSGINLLAYNTDRVDGYHASQTPTANTIPVAGGGGKINTGWLHASQTPTANTIPIVGSSGKLDTGWLQASQTPTANTIPVSNSSEILEAGWLTGYFAKLYYQTCPSSEFTTSNNTTYNICSITVPSPPVAPSRGYWYVLAYLNAKSFGHDNTAAGFQEWFFRVVRQSDDYVFNIGYTCVYYSAASQGQVGARGMSYLGNLNSNQSETYAFQLYQGSGAYNVTVYQNEFTFYIILI